MLASFNAAACAPVDNSGGAETMGDLLRTAVSAALTNLPLSAARRCRLMAMLPDSRSFRLMASSNAFPHDLHQRPTLQFITQNHNLLSCASPLKAVFLFLIDASMTAAAV